MNVRILFVAAALAAAAVVQADEAANKKQLARFDKAWKVESLILNGNALPANAFENLTIRFKDGAMVLETAMNGETKTSKLPVKIDASFDPGLFDVTPENDNKTLEGIYKFEGERLKLCVNTTGQNRPTEMMADASTALVTLSPKQE